jgi:hypothetical protein
MRSADDLRATWSHVDRLWDDAVAHAATLPETLLHHRVLDEWSFVETMRHLVFADDVWVGRMLRGGPSSFHPLGVPPTDTTDDAAAEMRLELTARPSFETVSALHAQRRAGFSRLLEAVTDAELPEVRTAVLAPDWGEESFTVLDCLTTVVREHADHLRFARRDLAVLESAAGGSAPA